MTLAEQKVLIDELKRLPPDVPFGTHRKTSRSPLLFLVTLYFVCFVAFVIVALRYPGVR